MKQPASSTALGLSLSVTCLAGEPGGRQTITFDAGAAAGTDSPLAFGANHRCVAHAAGGADPM